MTIYKRTNLSLGTINSTKLLAISSSETLYTISSGNIAFEATNLGAYNIYYGASGVLASSGGVINSSGSKFWDGIVGDFTLRFVVGTGGVTSNLLIQEYGGN